MIKAKLLGLRLETAALKAQAPTWGKASELAREWELNRLADRLAGFAQASAEG